MIFAQPNYLHDRPALKAVLASQLTLFAVSLPVLPELPLGVSAAFAGLLALRVWLVFAGRLKLALWQLVLMLGIVIALVLLQAGSLFGLQGGMAFLLLLGALKAFEGSTRRDWQVSALVQIFLLAGAVLFNQSLTVGLWVLACLMLVAVSLAMLNESDIRTAVRQSATGFGLTLLPMLLLFVAAPRTSAPLWGVPQNPSQQSVTGLSETMKPGSIGDLVQSNRLAFTATFSDGFMPRPQDLYWRVMIMAERSDSGEWRAVKGFLDNAFPIPDSTHPTVSYQIVLEDEHGRIPALDYPTRHQTQGVMQELGDVLRVYSRQGVRGITLYASVGDELRHKLTPPEQRLYTHINGNTNLRTQALAKTLYEQSGGNTERFIQTAWQYFARQGFAYTLRPPVLTPSGSTTDEFLFNTKQGFCEHYADAFVTIMRAAGVPARVVTGYQGGEWNAQGGFWEVRSKSAHAWAEVWVEGKNVWKRVDPTAAVSSSRVENGLDDALPAGEAAELLSNTGGWARFVSQSQVYWQRWVVNFDSEQQGSLFAWLGLGKVGRASAALLFLIGIIPALIPLWLWHRRARREEIQPMRDGFMLLKRRLLGKDHPNPAALGAAELQAELARQNRLPNDLHRLLQDFIALNYANTQAPAKRAAQAWYRRAKRLAHKYRTER